MRVLSDLSAALAIASIGFCSTSCQRGLQDIDDRVNKVLAQGSKTIDGGPSAPLPQYVDPASTQRTGQASKTVPTTNPPAGDLPYDAAKESQDVAARLGTYSAQTQATPDHPLRTIELTEAFRVAQQSGREYLDSEEEYILAAIRLLVERHMWGPRLFDDISAAVAGTGDQGNVQSALTVMNNLRVTQQLPYGGTVEAGLLWTATDQLRETVTGRYQQSAQFVLNGTVPLLRGAGLVAQENLIQAERNLIYQARTFETFRRQFLVAIARDYFDLLQARAQIANQQTVLDNLKEILRGEEARFQAGRIAEFHKNIAANDVLSATATMASLQEQYILQLDRFKIRLGLSPDEPLDLDVSVPNLPAPAASPETAVGLALAYRLDLQNQRDQLDDARRAVANAKNATLPDLNLAGQVGIPTNPHEHQGGLLLQPEDLNYQAAVTLGLPLDREIERLNVRQTTIAFQKSKRNYEQFRDQVAVDVRQSVRNIDLARFQLDLAERQVEINQRRMLEVKLKADTVDTQTKVDAANSLQQAQDARDAARTQLRNAILNYLLQSGQLRVAPDGNFQPLPGMEVAMPKAPAPPAPIKAPEGPAEIPPAPPA